MTFCGLKKIIFGHFSRFLAFFKISFFSLQHPNYNTEDMSPVRLAMDCPVIQLWIIKRFPIFLFNSDLHALVTYKHIIMPLNIL